MKDDYFAAGSACGWYRYGLAAEPEQSFSDAEKMTSEIVSR